MLRRRALSDSERTAPASAGPSGGPSERTIILLIGLVQFVNILDFVMVMPLGPDFARALSIDVARLGYLGGSYTAAAGVAGLVLAPWLDRYDRRWVLCFSMLGLVVGTGAGALAIDLPTLLAARIVAGFFGGPATASALAIITDVVPVERRGRAMGAVMAAFSFASVLGVPLGLFLARIGDWRTPFWALAIFGAAVTLGCVALLPPLRVHLSPAARSQPKTRLIDMLGRPEVRWSYLMTAAVMMSGFTIIPNISAYVQGNLGYPREALERLYAIGGCASFIAMTSAGRLVDATRPLYSGLLGVTGFAIVTATMFIWPVASVTVFFVAFMTVMALRNVAYQTLASRVPRPHERGRFMSLQSAIGHLAGAGGAITGSHLLTSLPGGKVGNIEELAYLAIGISFVIPVAMYIVETRLAERRVEVAAP